MSVRPSRSERLLNRTPEVKPSPQPVNKIPSDLKRWYVDDSRTWNSFNIFGRTIYHAYNCLNAEDIHNLRAEIDDELRINPDNKDSCIEATNGLFRRKLKNQQCWINFFKMVKMHMHNYADITNDPTVKQLKVHSYWAKRVSDISEEDYDRELYINTGNVHSHVGLDLGIVYYLQNPSRIYGTLIEDSGREFIVPGDENSMVIHHSSINHEGVVPPPKLTRDYPRIVIIVDFKKIKKC